MTEYNTSYSQDHSPAPKMDISDLKMCKLAEKKKHLRIKKLAAKPSYICKDCGRVSAKRLNLCKPEQI